MVYVDVYYSTIHLTHLLDCILFTQLLTALYSKQVLKICRCHTPCSGCRMQESEMGHQVMGSPCQLLKWVRSQVPLLVKIYSSKIIFHRIYVSQSVQLLGQVRCQVTDRSKLCTHWRRLCGTWGAQALPPPNNSMAMGLIQPRALSPNNVTEITAYNCLFSIFHCATKTKTYAVGLCPRTDRMLLRHKHRQ